MSDQFDAFQAGGSRCPILASWDGIGGSLGPEPTDFVVDEVPAYAPSGDGDHWFVRVRKRSLSTQRLCAVLARAADCAQRDIGFAGRKDTHAVTTQWLSLPKKPQDPDDDRIEILEVSRHPHKLRLGHLRGNRFNINLVDVQSIEPTALDAFFMQVKRGLPNYFGPQRFGQNARSLTQSVAALRAPRPKKKELRFGASVIQAALFNQWLGQRVVSDRLHQPLLGDILKKRETGGLFECQSVAEDHPRVIAGEVDVTGPMFGPKMWSATQHAVSLEEQIHSGAPLTSDDWERLGRFAKGTRRVARIVPQNVEWDIGDGSLNLSFMLPSGVYATVLLAALTGHSGST